MTTAPIVRRCAAEFIGTFALLFFGCGAIMLNAAGHLSSLAIPVVFALVVSTMVYALGHISGAHLNPAVTFAFVIARHFPFRDACVYTLSQLTGGLAAIAVLALLLPGSSTFGATLPNVSAISALAWEFILSFFLMLVIMSVATDTRAVGIMAGAAIGATIGLDAIVGGWATGASMNPARSFAPALFQGDLSALWIYILGPMAGTSLGGLTYKALARV